MKSKLDTVEPCNKVLGIMKVTFLYQVLVIIRGKKQANIKSWDQQNHLVIRGFCYIGALYNVPLNFPIHIFMFTFYKFVKKKVK